MFEVKLLDEILGSGMIITHLMANSDQRRDTIPFTDSTQIDSNFGSMVAPRVHGPAQRYGSMTN